MRKLILILSIISTNLFSQVNRLNVDALWSGRIVPITAQRQTTWLSFYNVIDNPALGTGSVVMSSAISTLVPGTPAGSNTWLQYNNAGVFGASANLLYNGTSLNANGLIISGNESVTGLSSVGSLSSTATATVNGLIVVGTESITGLSTAGSLSVVGTTTVGLIVVTPEAATITAGATTGLKIGGATSKLGLFNATPVVQQGATTDLGTVLSNLGLRASGTAYPFTSSGAMAWSGTTAFTNASNTFKHVSGNQSIGAVVLGTGSGTGATATTTACTDMAGLIRITTGTTPSATSAMITITFGTAYTAAPNVIITAANANSAAITGAMQIFPTGNTTNLVLTSGTVGLTGATIYTWYYQIVQ